MKELSNTQSYTSFEKRNNFRIMFPFISVQNLTIIKEAVIKEIKAGKEGLCSVQACFRMKYPPLKFHS